MRSLRATPFWNPARSSFVTAEPRLDMFLLGISDIAEAVARSLTHEVAKPDDQELLSASIRTERPSAF
jgi:hypothetical protein